MKVHKIAGVIIAINGMRVPQAECEVDSIHSWTHKVDDWKKVTCLKCLKKRPKGREKE